MSEKFYSLLTNIGKAKIANSVGLGTKINFSIMKVGDGGGSYYDPTEDQTDLKNVVWQGNINHVEIDEENPNWINIEVMIPSTVGGFTIREYGAFDEEGNMLGICKCAETYKPVIADGSTKELLLNLVLAVSNTSTVSLKVDPTIIFAKKSEVEQLRADINTQLSDMVQDSYPTVIATGTNSYVGSTDKIKALGKGITKLTLFVGADATGNCSLNLNSYGAKNIKDSFGNIVNNFKKDIPYNLCYNGMDFILQGKGGGGDALAPQLLINKKATVDTGPIVGTMPDNGGVSSTLTNNNQEYVIPAGFHNGLGKIKAMITNLAATVIKAGTTVGGIVGTFTSDATAVAADIVNGKTAYVNGNKITGNATIESLGGRKHATGTFSHTSGNSETITLPFAASIIIVTDSTNGYTYFWKASSMANGDFIRYKTNIGESPILTFGIVATATTITINSNLNTVSNLTYEIWG